MAPCAPWVTVSDDDLTLCAPADFVEGRAARATAAATELLWAASGRQFTGLCTDTVVPCESGWPVQWLAYPDGYPRAARPLPLSDGCPCADTPVPPWGLLALSALQAPNGPVVDVTEVIIDGVEYTGGVRVVNDLWLIRADCSPWPCCQHCDVIADPAAWQVTYRWGTAIPEAARLAAEVLTCELAKSWAQDKSCRLPKRLTQIVREGVSMTILDPFEFLENGKFGLYEVDSFISVFNPSGLQEPARVIVPELVGRRAPRVR